MLLWAAKLHELLVTLHGADGFVRVQLATSNRRVRGAAIGAHRTNRPIPLRLGAEGSGVADLVVLDLCNRAIEERLRVALVVARDQPGADQGVLDPLHRGVR